MEKILLIPLFVSFFTTLFFIPFWIRKSKQIGLLWEDMHKVGHPKNVAGSGGTIVLMSFVFGVLIYVAIKTFVLKTDVVTIEIFALLTSVLIAGLTGFVDDIFGWASGGLSARFRLVLLLFAAVPLMVINAGESTMLGINFGLFYPLFFIPFGILGASVSFNTIAGYNGLESSQGILILSALGFITWKTGNSWLSLICLTMIVCLFAFYLYNKSPAKVFPGDTLTYSVGAMIAIVAILGNIEKIAIFFFIPYIIEVVLKSRGRLKKASFAEVQEDGSLKNRYDKFYGIEHVAVSLLQKLKKDGKVYEQEVVYLINLFQILVLVVGILIFGGIF